MQECRDGWLLTGVCDSGKEGLRAAVLMVASLYAALGLSQAGHEASQCAISLSLHHKPTV